MKNLSSIEIHALMNESIANPQLTRTLLLEVTPQNELSIVRRIRGNLISLGYRTQEDFDTQERQDTDDDFEVVAR